MVYTGTYTGTDSEYSFCSWEHEHILNKTVGAVEVTLPNGVRLSFGQITALGGDYYGVPDQPIIDLDVQGDTSANQERFLAAYNTLARAPYEKIKGELDQILEVIENEQREVRAALRSGNSARSAYIKMGLDHTKKSDKITGGTWIGGVPVSFGRVMKLAQENYDHFLPNAKTAYLVGHELAVEKAREAGRCSDPKEKIKLRDEAYSLEAFAYHFLTDSFTAGHIRVPRIELPRKTTPAAAGHILCKHMHDEDNKFGLRVTNVRGDKWIAYGDSMLLDEESVENLKIMQETVRRSFGQVFAVYYDPDETSDVSHVTSLMPFVDVNERNNAPLFQVKDDELLRRADLNNLQDSATVSNWWAVTTLYKLRSYKPENSAV